MDTEEINDKFHYVYSSSLPNRIQIKIGTLEGHRPKPHYSELLEDPILKYTGLYKDTSDLIVVGQIFDQNEPLALPISSSYKSFIKQGRQETADTFYKPYMKQGRQETAKEPINNIHTFSNFFIASWNEWLTLPVQFSDLPRTAQLALTIYDCIGPNKLLPVGGTTISLFSKNGLFRQGIMDLRVVPNRKADGNCPSETPGKTKDKNKTQMERLRKLSKKHRNGHITKVAIIDWPVECVLNKKFIEVDSLDRLTFSKISLMNNEEKKKSDYLYLEVEFPKLFIDGILHYIVYFEQNGEDIHSFRTQIDIVGVPDQEILKENLVESKHHKLARSLRSGHCDKDAKPNAAVRDILNNIVSYPPTKQLSNEEQDHVWKFRFYLSNQKKALAKFLKCVNWTQPNEVRQALAMMKIWAPMDVEDALELLSPNFSHKAVRRYAISRLQQAPDEDIMLYLLQLVQALKYENFKDIEIGYARISPGREVVASCDDRDVQLEKKESTTTNELIMNRSSSYNQADQIAASNVNSVIEVDLESSVNNKQSDSNLSENILQNIYTNSTNTDTLHEELIEGEEEHVQDLATFLIHRACKNSSLANYFYWYLLIECEDQEPTIKQNVVVREMYLTVMKTFSQTLLKGTVEMQSRRKILYKQQKFLDKLVRLIKSVSRESGNRKKKIDKLQQLLADGDVFKFNFSSFEPMPFPLDPDIIIKGIIADKATLFKSALMPSKLYFKTINDEEYVAIFKHGDDLRQDQLILQMITLMDNLLRNENLDLKLTPYRVLATSTKHGFVQFIDSVSVAEAVTLEGSIHNYFRKYHPQENGPYGIAPDIMDNYIRSCAGYCVITYLLGVGDRHLDNLLLTTTGKLFHIDFGYILGRDPKPLPPPMKLSREMVDAMGGVNSEHYQEFRKQCYTAFLHLRRHANLMLNLFSLMTDASVPDIALEPDKAVKKVQDKLRLDLGEEEAVHYIQNLIDSSVTAVMAAIVEHFHKLTQYMRK